MWIMNPTRRMCGAQTSRPSAEGARHLAGEQAERGGKRPRRHGVDAPGGPLRAEASDSKTQRVLKLKNRASGIGGGPMCDSGPRSRPKVR